MMRIGVFGTCQAQGYAACVRALLPKAEVKHFFVNLCEVEEVHAFAADCDLFLAQPILVEEWGELRTSRLPQQHLAPLPSLLFTGFHPDVTYVTEWGAAHSLMGGYHSALIAACFCLGLPAERVGALFNTYVYAELGYLEEFARARSFLIASCAEQGIDVTDRIDPWMRDGSFMHTVNHPTVRVLFDIVRMALERAGLIGADVAADLPPDPLAGVSWAVHDCVADRIGIPSDPMFRVFDQATPADAFAQRSYAAYAEADDRAAMERVPAIARTMATLQRIGLR